MARRLAISGVGSAGLDVGGSNPRNWNFKNVIGRSPFCQKCNRSHNVTIKISQCFSIKRLINIGFLWYFYLMLSFMAGCY
jgi:hypothetical protein